MSPFNDELEALRGACLRIREEFFSLLEKHNPELIPLYQHRFEYAYDEHYPDAMRLHNMHEILRTYNLLKRAEKHER
jgi:hypothetical protein